MTRAHRRTAICAIEGCANTRHPYSRFCDEHRAEARAARRARYEAAHRGRNPENVKKWNQFRSGSAVEAGHLVWLDAEGGYVEAHEGEAFVERDGLRVAAIRGLVGEEAVPRHAMTLVGVCDWNEQYEVLLKEPRRIATYEYLNALLAYRNRFEHPIRFVIYGSGYDLTLALLDLSVPCKLELLNGGLPVRERPLYDSWEKRYRFLLMSPKERREYLDSLYIYNSERRNLSDLEAFADTELDFAEHAELASGLQSLRASRRAALMKRTKTYTMLTGPDGTVQRWRIEWVPSKWLIASLLWTRAPNETRGRKPEKGRNSFRIDDVVSNFQCPFIKALGDYLPESRNDIECVERGKEKRGSFIFPRDFAEVADYNRIEALWGIRLSKALLDASKQFFDAIVAEGIAPKRPHILSLYGPAALAKLALRMLHAEQWLGKVGIDIPPAAHEMAKAAYMAGRIEMMLQRVVEGPLYDYDRSSSYPDLISKMPSLRGGEWRQDREYHPEWPWSFYRIRYRSRFVNLPLYPFATRTRNGLQFNPWTDTTTTGFELAAALETCATRGFQRSNEKRRARGESKFVLGGKGKESWRGTIEIVDAWHYIPSEQEQASPSWGVFARLAQMRLDLKDAKNPAHRAAKLVLNSVYGILCQGIMTHSEKQDASRRSSSPKFFQIEYAAWDTAWTRAEVWRACSKDIYSVVTISTDGALVKHPLHIVDEKYVNEQRTKRGLPSITEDTARSGDSMEDNRLGAWSLKNVAEQAIVIQAGFYALKIDGSWTPFSRGFRKEQGAETDETQQRSIIDLRAERLFNRVFVPVLAAWERGTDEEIALPQNDRMLTLHEAMLADRPDLAGAFLQVPERKVRILTPMQEDAKHWNEKRMLWEPATKGTSELRTYPRYLGTVAQSTPYVPDFERERSFFDEVDTKELVEMVRSGEAKPFKVASSSVGARDADLAASAETSADLGVETDGLAVGGSAPSVEERIGSDAEDAGFLSGETEQPLADSLLDPRLGLGRKRHAPLEPSEAFGFDGTGEAAGLGE